MSLMTSDIPQPIETIMSTTPASEFRSSARIVMLRVPAGEFTMGSPESEDGHRNWEMQHEVAFAQDFYVGKSPVTQQQFAAVTGINPTVHEHMETAPIDSVNWHQANDYCQKLTELDHQAGVLPVDWHYRLPTEAEWEYACRAGSTEPRHGPLPDVAWFEPNAGDRPHPVGQKLPNPWGFEDMLGNVWEWCQDWFCAANRMRSVRGGSYFNSARFCRSAQRWGWMPENRGRYCGFRILAAKVKPFDLNRPIDEFPRQAERPTIFDAIDVNDFDLARQVIVDDPTAVESVDGIPPPLHDCIYHDKPEWVEWLLDHGANIERLEQDYGATPLTTAVVMQRTRIIPILVGRGANTAGALQRALNGLDGAYEDAGLKRDSYQEIVDQLRALTGAN